MAENNFDDELEDMMFGFAECTAPSLLEKELEDEAIVHLCRIWEEKA